MNHSKEQIERMINSGSKWDIKLLVQDLVREIEQLEVTRDSQTAVPSEESERLKLAIELMTRANELLVFLEFFKTPYLEMPERTRCVPRLLQDFKYMGIEEIKRGIAG